MDALEDFNDLITYTNREYVLSTIKAELPESDRPLIDAYYGKAKATFAEFDAASERVEVSFDRDIRFDLGERFMTRWSGIGTLLKKRLEFRRIAKDLEREFDARYL